MIEITIPGKPIGKERPRRGKSGRMYTPAKTRSYESLVAWCAKAATTGEINTSKLEINLELYYINHVYPDIDNVAKAILDGMEGVVYKNDKQVMILTIQRFVSRKYEPRAEIRIKEVE